jgi:Tol biopolymer transport system component
VTSQPGQEIYPSLSPDGEFVVYASNASGNWDIIFQRVGGETALNLTENSVVDDVQPSFSPDGKQVAFRSERNGGGIFLMGATGESVRRLSDIGFNPAWSPDGSEIAFATESVNGAADRDVTSQLWAVDVASGEKRLITERDAVQPSWSPNGSRIAYWSIEGAEGRRTTKRDIWTIPAKGGEPVPITQDAYVDWNPVWSRDGSHLYFSSDRGGSMNLWRVRIEESSGKVIGQYEAVTTGASASRQHLSVSSEGEQIAYVERVLSRNLWKTRFDPATGNVQGKPIPITRGSRQVGDAHISPNGDWLACRSFGKQEDIFIVRTDGTGLRQLTNDLHRDRRPQWSPDGERIAFYSNRSGSHEIWTINHDGSGLQKLSETPGVSVWRPIWSPDGLSMAYYKPSEHTSYLFDPNTSWEMQTPQALPPFSDAQESFMCFSWSPDGSIAGVIESAGSFAGVTVYSLESKQYKKLTEFGSRPVWLADNRRLLFDDHGALFMVDSISGGIHEVLSTAPDIVRYASISPDNRWIYFSRIATEADIWILTLNEERE